MGPSAPLTGERLGIYAGRSPGRSPLTRGD